MFVSTPPAAKRLRIAIDFRVPEPRQGVGMAVIALAHGLARLNHPGQEYVFVVYDHSKDWLEPHMAGNCSAVSVPSAAAAGAGRGWESVAQSTGAARAGPAGSATGAAGARE